MSTLIRSIVVAVALIGTVSAASAAPYYQGQSVDNDSFRNSPIDNFNRLTHKND